jgi:regulator of replication initiation timing
MGKKSKTSPPSPTPAIPCDTAMEAQFADIKNALGQMQAQFIAKMENIERSLHDLRVENTAVREELASARVEIAKRDETIQKLSEQVNKLDQASRSNFIRVFGLEVTPTTPYSALTKTILDEIIAPCLAHAREAGDLPPTAGPSPFLIDQAFVVPTKKGGHCPVIVKLSNQTTRNLIFRHKKAALPQDRDLASNKVRPRYSVYEDLTPANHAHLRSLSADPRIKSIWSYNGQIRFKAHDSEDIVKVRALTDTFDTLTKPANAMSH